MAASSGEQKPTDALKTPSTQWQATIGSRLTEFSITLLKERLIVFVTQTGLLASMFDVTVEKLPRRHVDLSDQAVGDESDNLFFSSRQLVGDRKKTYHTFYARAIAGFFARQEAPELYASKETPLTPLVGITILDESPGTLKSIMDELEAGWKRLLETCEKDVNHE